MRIDYCENNKYLNPIYMDIKQLETARTNLINELKNIDELIHGIKELEKLADKLENEK